MGIILKSKLILKVIEIIYLYYIKGFAKPEYILIYNK